MVSELSPQFFLAISFFVFVLIAYKFLRTPFLKNISDYRSDIVNAINSSARDLSISCDALIAAQKMQRNLTSTRDDLKKSTDVAIKNIQLDGTSHTKEMVVSSSKNKDLIVKNLKEKYRNSITLSVLSIAKSVLINVSQSPKNQENITLSTLSLVSNAKHNS